VGTTRQLGWVLQELKPLVEQGRVEGFFDNTENANKLDGLIEDIREALMDYQVCISNCSCLPYLTFMLDFIAT